MNRVEFQALVNFGDLITKIYQSWHLQGMLMMTLADEDAPCYTTIFRRLQSLGVKREGNMFTGTGNGAMPVSLAIDSTGFKQHNRGGWTRQKWKVRRGFVKLHVLQDMASKA